MLDYSRLTEQTSFVADPMPQFEVGIDIAGSVPTSELVPDAGRPLRLGVSHPWWSVVENAVRLSVLTGGPVALVRVVDEQSWH